MAKKKKRKYVRKDKSVKSVSDATAPLMEPVFETDMTQAEDDYVTEEKSATQKEIESYYKEKDSTQRKVEEKKDCDICGEIDALIKRYYVLIGFAIVIVIFAFLVHRKRGSEFGMMTAFVYGFCSCSLIISIQQIVYLRKLKKEYTPE